MRHIAILLMFTIWVVATIILAITVLGLLVVIEGDWLAIPDKLVNMLK